LLASDAIPLVPFGSDKGGSDLFKEGWASRWGDEGEDWKENINAFQGISTDGRTPAIYWLRNRVPELHWDDAALLLPFPVTSFEIFIGGEKRFANAEIDQQLQAKKRLPEVGQVFFFVPLKQSDVGK